MLLNLFIGFVFCCFVFFAAMTLYYALGKTSGKKKSEPKPDDASVNYTSHINLDE